MVSYSIDKCRQDFLVSTVNSLRHEIDTKNLEIDDDIVVFDNASPHLDTLPLLTKSFKNVFLAEKNYGLWSAINWAVNKYQNKFDCIHVIESDLVYYSLEKMQQCEETLMMRPSIGCVWCMEFSIANKHLFSKDDQRPDSVKRSWLRQSANVIGQPVVFREKIVGDVYECSMNPQLVGLLRMKTMKSVFDRIKPHSVFTEFDFYTNYFSFHPVNAVCDGGILYSDGNIYSSRMTSGSWTFNSQYMETRKSFVHDLQEMKVTQQ
jgi:hypothetical protein